MKAYFAKLLLHPAATLTALVVGLTSLAATCGSVAIAVGPLAQNSQLAFIGPHIAQIVTTLGTVAGVCLALAAVGRSIISFIDQNGQPPAPTPSTP